MNPSTKRQELYADLKRAVEILANETDTARQSELFCDYLRCASLFHDYSWGNQMMIWTQRPTATRVAGYHTWRKMGRHVKQGQKGIAIFAPMVIRSKEAADPARVVTAEKEQVWFRVVYVFDVAQTEGQPLPDLPTSCEGNSGDLEPTQSCPGTALAGIAAPSLASLLDVVLAGRRAAFLMLTLTRTCS